jgi:hypothetical protein
MISARCYLGDGNNPPETRAGEKEMKRHCGSSENLWEKV